MTLADAEALAAAALTPGDMEVVLARDDGVADADGALYTMRLTDLVATMRRQHGIPGTVTIRLAGDLPTEPLTWRQRLHRAVLGWWIAFDRGEDADRGLWPDYAWGITVTYLVCHAR